MPESQVQGPKVMAQKNQVVPRHFVSPGVEVK